MKNPIKLNERKERMFLQRERALSKAQIELDLEYIKRNLRIGLELECVNLNVNQTQLARTLKTTATAYSNRDISYDNINEFGIQRIYSDATLCSNHNNTHTAEIVFSGSNEAYGSYYERLLRIHKILWRHTPRGLRCSNKSCGEHITLVTSQNKPLSMVYLINFYQLYKKYADVVAWLTSGTNESGSPNAIHRVMLGNTYSTIISPKSPITSSMAQIIRESQHYDNPSLDEQKIIDDDTINGFRIEIRIADRIPIPHVETSLVCLLRAMLYKAIELSEYGVVNVESNGNWTKTKGICRKFKEGETLTTEDMDYLRTKTKGLIKFLKPMLNSFDGLSIHILNELAEKPTAFRLREGKNDEQINDELSPYDSSERETEMLVRQIIDLQIFEGLKDTKEWKKAVADELGVTVRQIEKMIAKLSKRYKVDFDKDLGTYTRGI